jgi:hypothetical protein
MAGRGMPSGEPPAHARTAARSSSLHALTVASAMTRRRLFAEHVHDRARLPLMDESFDGFDVQ